MELNQLRYFLKVSETLHFNQAAKQLHITQQPLSYQIKQLEKELGFKLFERTTREVALTPAGAAFQAEVRAGLERIDHGVDIARSYASGENGILTIGYTSATLFNVLPEIVRRFRNLFPHVEIVLSEMDNLRTWDQEILNEGIDVGIVTSEKMKLPGLLQETIYSEPLVVALPKNHPLSSREKIALTDLANEPILMYARRVRPQIFDEFITLCHQAGFSPSVVQEATDGSALVSLVSAGLGVAAVAKSLSILYTDAAVYLPLVEPSFNVEVVLVWKEGKLNPWLKDLQQISREITRNSEANK